MLTEEEILQVIELQHQDRKVKAIHAVANAPKRRFWQNDAKHTTHR